MNDNTDTYTIQLTKRERFMLAMLIDRDRRDCERYGAQRPEIQAIRDKLQADLLNPVDWDGR